MLTINQSIARRFILGKQGLWPGRRWRGSEGVAKAMREIEHLQLDPLQIIARSHDIMLHSRVLDYKPGLWEDVTYQQRQFFEWGGWLAVRPMEELPHWRVLMRRERDGVSRIHQMGHDYADAIVEMLQILRERGVVCNRDFKTAKRKRTRHYRGRKDSTLALYYLWRTGEVMIHHRQNFERFYALTESVAPAHLIYESNEAEAERFFIKKEISFNGLLRVKRSNDTNQSRAMLADGEIIEVCIESWKGIYHALASDLQLLQELSAGRIPQTWAPLETTTTEEVLFLAPLDPVSARGRAKIVFDFDYAWEVYKPAHKRKFGYYTLPILWGDQLVARFDSKLDRTTNTFVILGFWLEDQALAQNDAFANALASGFARFLNFLGADKFDTTAIGQPLAQLEAVKN